MFVALHRDADKKDDLSVGYFQLFRFASCKDVAMMVVGGLCALVHGAAAPLMLLVYGMMTNTFVGYELEIQQLKDPNKTCSNESIHWTNGTVFETSEGATVPCG
uniref:ABC transmembrane type-1 domain-containing protein n=1 Tax=Knipowitschia caucasica TaxID=637954 RepID=A0AAV2JZC2_KNICA